LDQFGYFLVYLLELLDFLGLFCLFFGVFGISVCVAIGVGIGVRICIIVRTWISMHIYYIILTLCPIIFMQMICNDTTILFILILFICYRHMLILHKIFPKIDMYSIFILYSLYPLINQCWHIP